MKIPLIKYWLITASFLTAMPMFVTSQSQSDKILELINLIEYAYVDTVNMDQLSETAIISMLAELDPHSLYIPKKKVQAMNESLEGSFDGIGIRFDIFKDSIFVVAPITDGPSRDAGIIAGDRIISAQGKNVSGVGITDEEIMEMLRGKKGSKVNLQVKRSGDAQALDFEVMRDKIPIKSVDAFFMISENVGYVKIDRFAKTTVQEFENAIKSLKKEGMENLVLDLRGNGGGYLYSAVQITDEFLNGKEVIVSTKGLNQSDQVFRAKPKGLFTEGKLVVLIDEGSASASEILAGAIQDWDRGIILGRRSFGKGLVMKPFYLSDGSMVRLTTSRYYTPSGRCIQKNYNESKDEYDDDIQHRFEKGEFFSMDSIDLPKDLKFKTKEGRSVYGGGGILPDIFFPADTLILGDRYQEILKSETILEFTMNFFNANRMELMSAYSLPIEIYNDQELSSKLLSDYSNFLKEHKPELKVFNDMNLILTRQFKAFLAQYIWNESTYFHIISQDQEILNEAKEVMNNWDYNWSMLSERIK